MSFAASLEKGLVGESRIAQWFVSRGNHVLPVYETEQEFKGPRIFSPTGELVATDMFVFNQNKAFWIEAKNKSAFSWHRLTKRWTTGIDIHHYEDYLTVREQSGLPTYLMFLQNKGVAKDSPAGCPTGLYGGELGYLCGNENHRHMNWGKHGMVYWASDVLRKYAELSEL